MGLESSLLGIDIDEGDGKSGEKTWKAHGLLLPATVQTRTMSGGRHIFFKIPLEFPIRNSASTVFGPNIDVRGAGGYVVWAGSQMENGSYEFIEGCSPEENTFAEMPEAILDFFKRDNSKSSNANITRGRVFQGNRNASLFQASVKQVHAGLTDEAVRKNAYEINGTYDVPLDEDEVDRTVHSAQSYRRNHVMPFTDLGNAERFKRDATRKFLFVKEAKRWLIFNGEKWVHDLGAAERQAHQTIRTIVYEGGSDPDAIQAAQRWQKTSEAASRIKAMLEVASSLDGMSASKSIFDRKPDLINFENGTFELIDGQFRAHRAEDMLTKIAGCIFDPSAKAERWDQFISEVMDSNEADALYLQKLIGYCLWGKRPEQSIQFFLGDGGDGKSVFLETVRKALGDYQITLSAITFSAKNPASIPNDVARLSGARFAGVSELPKGLHVNTQLLKGISGGDSLSARFLHQEFFDFAPEAVLLFVTNFYPFIDVEDKAFLRRVRLLRFPKNFSENEPDLRLPEKLGMELPGIINWALQGFQMYQSKGLDPTANMLNELSRYRKFIDPLDGFYEDKILVTNDITSFIPTDKLFEEAKAYAMAEDRGKVEKLQLVQYMRIKGHERIQRRIGRDRVRGYTKFSIVAFKDDDLPF
jgi:putative DNA primase/helicase